MKRPWIQSSTFFPFFGFYKGRTSHIGLFDEPKITHIFYIIIGLKIIKWTVCTHWVHTKITTQSCRAYSAHIERGPRPGVTWTVECWTLTGCAECCVLFIFGMHFMRADCSFDYFLPINEQFACGECVQKCQRAYSEASKCPMRENPLDICMWC